MQAFAGTKALADAQRAAARKAPRQRRGMPAENSSFARRSTYSFAAAWIRQNAPAWGGIYGLSNAQHWIYIRAVDDIRIALPIV